MDVAWESGGGQRLEIKNTTYQKLLLDFNFIEKKLDLVQLN